MKSSQLFLKCLQKAHHRTTGTHSSRFAGMLQDKLHVFCCPFFRSLKRKHNCHTKPQGHMNR